MNNRVLSAYINAAMALATHEELEDGSCYAEIRELPGVWANGPTRAQCETELREVIEDWIVLGLREGDDLPIVAGINLNTIGRNVA